MAKKQTNWSLVIVEAGTTDFLKISNPTKSDKGYETKSQLSLNFPVVDYGKEEVESLVDLALELLDRWPWSQFKTPAFVRHVTAVLLPNHPLHYPPIGSYKDIENNTTISLRSGMPH